MWPFRKKLEDVLFKRIVVHGVEFLIKKIDPSNFLDGSKVMIQAYDIYKLNKPTDETAKASLDKVREHYRDVFMASVLSPKLKRKEEEPEGLFVEYLFTDWELSHELYARIMEFTYGKKKIKRNTLRARTP
jgi:hypothetical protein